MIVCSAMIDIRSSLAIFRHCISILVARNRAEEGSNMLGKTMEAFSKERVEVFLVDFQDCIGEPQPRAPEENPLSF